MTPKELVAFWLDLLHWCHVLKKSGWCKAEGSWDLEGVERVPGVRGFSIQPRRWVVERTFGWLSRSRRLSKDYERKVQTSETLIQIAMIRLLIARLGRSAYPIPKHAHEVPKTLKRLFRK